MTDEELLELFGPLYEEATALAPRVFADEHDDIHPCAYLIRRAYDQHLGGDWGTNWQQLWHLPEPFNGEVVGTNPQVAFVGINPSINPHERCPTNTDTLGDWLKYYRNRFNEHGRMNDTPRQPSLYGYYNRLLIAASGEHARIGRDGVVVDMIPYKARHYGTNEEVEAAGAACLPLTLTFLHRLGTRVIVAASSVAVRMLAAHLGVLIPTDYAEAHGRAYPFRSPFVDVRGVQRVLEGTLIPTYHTNSRNPALTTELRLEVARTLAEVLGHPEPDRWPR